MPDATFKHGDGGFSADTECSPLLRSTDISKWIISGKDESGQSNLKKADNCNLIDPGRMHSVPRRSRKIVPGLLLTHVTILLLQCLPGVGANLSVVWCVDSSGEQLLNLTCGSASLIRINSVIHGWRNAIQEEDPSGCLAPTQDICAEKYPNIRLLVDTCSGLSTCVFSSLEIPAPLSSCSGRRSNYVNITYECVIVGNETIIVDICDNRQNHHDSLRKGYITSPNYPQNYDANTKCSCQLSAPSSADGDQRSSTEVVLQLLDFDLSLAPNERSPFDWLQYASQGLNWGDGRLMGNWETTGLSPADPIFTGSDRIDVDFNTDEQREGRGFWLKVIGMNITSKEEIPVEIECGPYNPPDSRQAVSCFEPPRSGELYLSCTAFGVINILRVQAGYRPPVNQTTDVQPRGCTTNDIVEQTTCISDVDIPPIESQCMRRTSCNPTAPSSVNITAVCGNQPNNFVLVDFQCIPDSSQSGNMVSICGEDMAPGTTFVRESGSGFISSPLYPSNYPPDCNCICRLEVTSSTPQTAQIVLYVLDLELSRTPEEELGNSICSSLASGCLNSDWLQYGSAGQSPGTGRNLSMDEKGKPVYTGSNVVLISFHSDSLMEDRGFWIKYVGRSLLDGSNSPVMVRCGRFQPPQSGPQGGGNSTEPTSNTSPTAIRGVNGINQSQDEAGNNKTGLIVGVTVAVIVVVVVLVALIAVILYRRWSRVQSAKLLNESKTNSWNSGLQGLSGFSAASDRGTSQRKTKKLFARWKRGNNETPAIDKPHSPSFAIFYNEAYKMQDPTLYRNLHSSARKKRLSPPPTDETIHF